MGDREQHVVELVGDDGHACGSTTVERAHRTPGLAHRAFSVMLTDLNGRLLLQQRAATKTRFALRWANACCGHPGPGQDILVAGAERVTAELGLPAPALVEVGVHRYHAHDPATDRVEREYDHILTGRTHADQSAEPDPAEVADLRWLHPYDLAAELAHQPDHYAPWLPGVLHVWAAARDVPHTPTWPALTPASPDPGPA